MTACGTDKKAMFSLYDRMLASDVRPDAQVYSMLVQASTHDGDFDAADEVFKHMRQQVAKPFTHAADLMYGTKNRRH